MSAYRVCPFANCAELNDRDAEWCEVCGRYLLPLGMQMFLEPGTGGPQPPSSGRSGGMGTSVSEAVRRADPERGPGELSLALGVASTAPAASTYYDRGPELNLGQVERSGPQEVPV